MLSDFKDLINVTWNQRCAPGKGHTCAIFPFSWIPSSHPPPHPAENRCCDPKLCTPPLV